MTVKSTNTVSDTVSEDIDGDVGRGITKFTNGYEAETLINYTFKVPMKWNFSPLFYSRKSKSMLHWFIIFEFKLCSGAESNFSIPPKLPKNAIVVFRGLELVTS